MKIYTKIAKNLHLAVFFCAITIGATTTQHHDALAAPTPNIATTPCDPAYYDSLEARAWLEAQREITQNQNLIYKADSVLQYTCFDKYLNVLADEATYLFSETTEWGTVLKSDSMDKALQELVGAAASEWVSANFNHKFLGDRWGSINPPPQGNSGYSLGGVSGGSYSCDVMDRVWHAAKCVNFIMDEDEDGFYSLTQYSTDPDKRFLPKRCENEPRWSGMLGTALTATPWPNPPIATLITTLKHGNCGSQYFPPIPTGITVKRPLAAPFDEYEEKICLQTGCHYVPTSKTAGTCTK